MAADDTAAGAGGSSAEPHRVTRESGGRDRPTDKKVRPPGKQGRPRAQWGRPTGKDVLSGFVTGLFSIPEGMAYASIGGFAAPLGLWSGIVPTIVGSLFARTVLMVTTLTSAIALSAQSVLSSVGLKTSDLGAIATLTVMVGLVMLFMGLLKLGTAMSFVSTAVMTGFTTGIALQIIAGVIKDVTGYSPSVSNTIGKFVDAFANIGKWDPAALMVAGGTVLIWLIFRIIKPTRSLATLIALLLATVGTVLLPLKVELVSDIATVPRSLPPFTLPDVSTVVQLIPGAIAIALVALAQAAGIGSAVPNPDGSRTNASRDFVAQGLANVAGGFFSALPTGGSLSRTGVATGAGAQTRWTGVFSGVWLAIIVLAVGPLAGYIPMAVIGGLMLVIGGELLFGRWHDIVLVARTSWLSLIAMVVTFAATTQLPLQQAIFLGAGLSIVLTAVAVSRKGRIYALVRGDRGWNIADPPARLPSDETTVLHYAGSGFFSEVNQIEQEWPDISGTHDAGLVLSVRGSDSVPSATFVKSLEAQDARLRAHGIRLVICGVDPRYREMLVRTHALDRFGADNVIPATSRLTGALEAAYARAEHLRHERPNDSANS